MYFESRDQKYVATGRFWSLVIGRADAKGSLTAFTQTFMVPVSGLIKEMYLPSGEIWAPAYSGFPKKTSRSTSAGCCAAAVETATHANSAMDSRVLIFFVRTSGSPL